jgi:hypothetical protein
VTQNPTSLPSAGPSPARGGVPRSSLPRSTHPDGLSGRWAGRAQLVPGVREQLLIIAGAASARHHFNVRLRRNHWETYCFPIGDFEALSEALPRFGEQGTVYLGCAPRAREQGGREAVVRVECLWADVDSDRALERLEGFPLPPTLVVASGGGTEAGERKRHCYWRLTMGVTPDEADVALKRLACALGADSRCAEPARVLRPVGTRNYKHGGVLVEALACDLSAEYALGDVLEATPDLHVDGEAPAPRQCEESVKDLLRASPLGELEAALKQIEPLVYVEALTGRRPGRDGKIACPFHSDEHPSFHVYGTSEAGWYCFQCDQGGTIIDLGVRLYKLDPVGAGYVRLLHRLAEGLLG